MKCMHDHNGRNINLTHTRHSKESGFTTITLSEMDTTFMATYALGSFVSGRLGDTYRPTTILGLGLFGSGICLVAMLIVIYSDLEHITESLGNFTMLFIYFVFGFFQSTGGPVGTAIMGAWFSDSDSVKVSIQHFFDSNVFHTLLSSSPSHLTPHCNAKHHSTYFQTTEPRSDLRAVDLSSVHGRHCGGDLHGIGYLLGFELDDCFGDTGSLQCRLGLPLLWSEP